MVLQHAINNRIAALLATAILISYLLFITCHLTI